MQEMVVARRYAQALALEAQAAKIVEPVSRALAFFADEIARKTELFQVMDNPAFGKFEREAVVRSLCAPNDLNELVARFLFMLIHKNRMKLLPLINDSYTGIVDEMLGRARATVSCAVSLNEAARTTIFENLERLLGKKIIGTVVENPQLLGGVLAEVDGLVLDGTLRGRLQELERNMIN